VSVIRITCLIRITRSLHFVSSFIQSIREPTVQTVWDPQLLKILWASTACYGDSFTFLYLADVRTSQETYLCASTACYGHSFDLLYIADVRTSQETHLWTSTSCYGDSFTFLYLADIRTSQETHLWPPRPATGIALLLYLADIRTSQETHLWASTACYGDTFTFLYLDDVRT
jgi:hypothetical protein